MNTRALAVLALVAAAAPAFADPLTGNGGFETAGMGPTMSAQWFAGGGGAAGTLSERSSANPFSGSWSQNLNAVGSDLTGASAVITQNSIADVGLPSLAPGSSLSLSFRGNYTLGPGGVGFYALKILNGSGAIVADTGLQVITGSTAGYQLFSTSALTVPAFGAAPNDTYAAFVEISVAGGAFNGSFAQAYIDDVNVQGTTIPAPASLALVSGGLLLAGRRRRA
ncbi:MAG: hypothetical protein WC718_04530 [Phycisphaerales bacterium]|jgi:hypothetical protein